jgi:DNA-binding beta-propeller fold protein YncE
MKRIFLILAGFFLLLNTGCSLLEEQFPLPTHVPTIALPTDAPIKILPAARVSQTSTPMPAIALTPTRLALSPMPVWVSSPIDQVVLRIDPLSNSIAAVVAVDGNPEMVEVGLGAVWALDRMNNQVFRIEPNTNQVTAVIPLPSGKANALAVGSGFVWVGMTGKINLAALSPQQGDEILPPSWVLAIDPESNRLREDFAVQPVNRLAVSGKKLWVLSRGVIDTPIQIIDLENRQGLAVPLRNAPDWLPADALAVDAENLWLLSTAYGKIFHATTDGQIQAAVNLEASMPTGYPDLLLTSSGLWAATPWGTVLRIDPETNRVKGRVDLGLPLTQLIDGQDSIWVLSQQAGMLFRIDIDQNVVTAQIATGTQVQPTVVPSPTPRIVIWKPCPDAPLSRLKVGITAYVTTDPPVGNRVREEPNREAEILGVIKAGASMKIIEGPACSDGWVWWRMQNANYEGWTAEGDQSAYWLIPVYE